MTEKTVTKATKPTETIKAYDLRWDVMHAKQLVDNDKIQQVKDYVKKFFFHYQGQVFFFTGTSHVLYDRCKAMELIPDDIVRDVFTANMDKHKFETNEFKLKNFLKTSEFMKDQYQPTIDFSQTKSIFSETTIVQGVPMEKKYINMGKRFMTR